MEEVIQKKLEEAPKDFFSESKVVGVDKVVESIKNTENKEVSSDNPINKGEIKDEEIRDEKGRILPGHTLPGNGKPKGTQHFSTLFKNALKEYAKTQQGKEIPYDVAMVNKMIKMALEGNVKCMELIMDRVDGKPKSTIELEDSNVYVLSKEDEERVDKLFAIKNQIKQKDDGVTNNGDKQGENKSIETGESSSAYEGNE
ncbi:MAG TPA: DUF5681 domain-containing protein [Bacilli bacterium]|nr:DUF5681 domain-containing protein [Bacilli bacterium]